jgi:hypothetical protein
MFYSLALTYLFIKLVFFYSLVRIHLRFEPMKDRWLLLGVLYTAGVAFLSYVFLMSWQSFSWAPWQIRVALKLGVSPWQAWVGETFVLSTLYFRLMAKFDEGLIFWMLFLSGLLLVWF